MINLPTPKPPTGPVEVARLPDLQRYEDPFAEPEKQDYEDLDPPAAAPVREPFVPLGVQVDVTQHSTLFRRDWSKVMPRETWTPPVVPPPLTPARPLQAADKAPAECLRQERVAVAHGHEVIVRYAQGGAPRPQGEVGTCGVCRQTVSLYVDDGLLFKHNVAAKDCGGVALLEGRCVLCKKKVAARKDGTLAKHTVAAKECAGGGEEPRDRRPREPAPPVRSVQMKVKGVGVAWWVDDSTGKWKHGGAMLLTVRRGARVLVECSADEFAQALKKERM